MKKSQKIKIHLAFSNPAFELWFLLHFEEMKKDAPIKSPKSKYQDSQELKCRLKKHIPDYNESLNLYPQIKDSTKSAISRAKRLFEEYEEPNIYRLVKTENNPLTGVYKLVEEIIDY